MNRKLLIPSIAVSLCGAAINGTLFAQPGNAPKSGAENPAAPAQAGTDNPNRVVLSRGMTVSEAAAAMAKAANATVIVDPLLNGRVSESTSRLPLEQGLGAMAKLHHAEWRKLYLAENEIPHRSDGAIDVRRLKQAVVAATSVPLSLGVVDPATGQLTVTTRAPENDAAMQAWAKGRKVVYLLYSREPDTDEAAPGAGMKTGDMLPPGGIDAFRKMSPEERQQWMKDHHGVIITPDMSPEERERAIQTLPPEMQQHLRDRMKDMPQGGANGMMILRYETKTDTQPAQ